MREAGAYRIRENGPVAGKSIAQAEGIAGGERIFVERLRRDGEIVPHNPDTVLKAGDIIAVSGRREVLVNTLGEGEEVEDREALDIPIEAVDVLITSKALDGRELVSLAKETLHARRLSELHTPRLGCGEHSCPFRRRNSTVAISSASPGRGLHSAQVDVEVGDADRPQTAHRHGSRRPGHHDRRPLWGRWGNPSCGVPITLAAMVGTTWRCVSLC